MNPLDELRQGLRRWPRNVLADQRAAAAECVEHCRDILRAERVLLFLEEEEEPWLFVAQLDGRGAGTREEESLSLEELVVEQASDETFLAATDDPRIHPRVREQLGDGVALTVPVLSENVRGRLFATLISAGEEVRCIGETLGTLIAMRLEASLSLQSAAREAVEQDRVRVARDLHDGLLQSFTGVVLQLETIHSLVEQEPGEARRLITEAQAMIMADQRELRHFVEQLRPRPAHRETPFEFTARLEDLRQRFAKQWGMSIVFDVERIDPRVSAFLGQETYRLLHEAVTNAAKHGRASEVRVGLRTDGSEMHIEVADNGSGFPFRGRRSVEELRESGSGPMMLADRVQSLNGTLTVESSEGGAVVHMSIPLGWGAGD